MATKKRATKKRAAPKKSASPKTVELGRVRIRNSGMDVRSDYVVVNENGDSHLVGGTVVNFQIASCSRVYLYLGPRQIILPPEMEAAELKAHVEKIVAEPALDGLNGPYVDGEMVWEAVSFPDDGGEPYKRHDL